MSNEEIIERCKHVKFMKSIKELLEDTELVLIKDKKESALTNEIVNKIVEINKYLNEQNLTGIKFNDQYGANLVIDEDPTLFWTKCHCVSSTGELTEKRISKAAIIGTLTKN